MAHGGCSHPGPSPLCPRGSRRVPPPDAPERRKRRPLPPPPRHKVTPLCLHVPGGRAPPTAHGGVREGAADGRRKSSGSIGASRAAFSSPSSQDVRRPDPGDRFKSRTEEMNLSGDLLQWKKKKTKKQTKTEEKHREMRRRAPVPKVGALCSSAALRVAVAPSCARSHRCCCSRSP